MTPARSVSVQSQTSIAALSLVLGGSSDSAFLPPYADGRDAVGLYVSNRRAGVIPSESKPGTRAGKTTARGGKYACGVDRQ
jgi:hypothetical protein